MVVLILIHRFIRTRFIGNHLRRRKYYLHFSKPIEQGDQYSIFDKEYAQQELFNSQ
jgi:hypothetical protein